MLHVKNKRMVQLNVSIKLVLKSNVTDVSRIVSIYTVFWKYHYHQLFHSSLKEELETSKGHLLYLIDVHIFSEDDIKLNTKTLRWPSNIKPVFEQNTEIVEDCKARFEDNLQKKSDWITKELQKLSLRVQELEELGEILNIQQYTYVSIQII